MSKNNDFKGSIIGLVALVAAFVFLLIGFTTGIWNPTWLVFLAIPLTSMIIGVTQKKDIGGMIISIVSLLSVIVYFLLGFCLNLWHPGWLVFFAVPITSTIVNLIKHGKNTEGSSN